MVTGATFSKPDGQRIGYESTLDSESNTYYIQNQTLFQDGKNPNLIALLKQGVRSYFNDNGQSMTDEELSDMLINVGDINHIPLPQYAPYFTPQGLTFVYQQYEIAPYAAGLPCFTLSYEKVLPFLTDEAARLTK